MQIPQNKTIRRFSMNKILIEVEIDIENIIKFLKIKLNNK